MSQFHNTIVTGGRHQRRLSSIMSSTALSTIVALVAAPALAQTAKPAQSASESAVEEVVVTGSRIVREGYESPTPLTVIGSEALTNNADPNLLAALATTPAISGVSNLTNSTDLNARGGTGVQSLNLRSLGTNRVLVLLDGQRFVPATVTNAIDVGVFPTQLIQRVDVVTGGASAVYGSDAVAGVVNFVLDKKFTGVKGEISGGVTNYGDGKNYKIDLSAGFGFGPDDRGHVLVSGSQMFNAGIKSTADRAWTDTGYNQITNPAYGTGAGQSTSVPQFLVMFGTAASTQTAGGIIVTPGPLKGTAFGAGGTPYKFNYGSLFNAPVMTGGDWQANNMQHGNDLAPSQSQQNLFVRTSYDITDNISANIQWIYAAQETNQQLFWHWMPGAATGTAAILINQDNAFLPASVRTAMIANGITQFSIGTWNGDAPDKGGRARTRRIVNDVTAGLEGNFDAFGSNWKWNASYTAGGTKFTLNGSEPINARYRQAIDAVVNPATGQIVCRIALTTPTTPCRPWNPMGIGVNTGNSAAWSWINGDTDTPNGEHGLIKMESVKASITGELGSTWAGPISEAISFEHTHQSINAVADPISAAAGRIYSNFASLAGSSYVNEGALETIVPLAKGESWAKAWDLTAAVRFTGYQYAGYVTTWKVGTTYSIIDDFDVRVTRSRDIRAPTIIDNFSPGQSTNSSVLDRFRNSTYNFATFVSGNTALAPEKADTTGIGVVLRPRFLDGFTLSVDYWNIDIAGAISTLSSQNVMDLCYNGSRPELCNSITRDPASGLITRMTVAPINLAIQSVKGLDFETSYRTPVSNIVSSWNGDFSVHGNMTVFLKAFQDTTLTPRTYTVGQASGAYAVPDWKLTVTATYTLDPVTVSLTGRAISSLTQDNSYVECTTGCPVSTAFNPTYNINHIKGVFYLDANVGYDFLMGDSKANFFVAAKNILNKGVPLINSGASNYYSTMGHTTNAGYDYFGAVYRVGLRFKM